MTEESIMGKPIRDAAREYFVSDLQHTPLVIGNGDSGEVQIWRHAGHNGAVALAFREGVADTCFIFNEPAELDDFIQILLGAAAAIEQEDRE